MCEPSRDEVVITKLRKEYYKNFKSLKQIIQDTKDLYGRLEKLNKIVCMCPNSRDMCIYDLPLIKFPDMEKEDEVVEKRNIYDIIDEFNIEYTKANQLSLSIGFNNTLVDTFDANLDDVIETACFGPHEQIPDNKDVKFKHAMDKWNSTCQYCPSDGDEQNFIEDLRVRVENISSEVRRWKATHRKLATLITSLSAWVLSQTNVVKNSNELNVRILKYTHHLTKMDKVFMLPIMYPKRMTELLNTWKSKKEYQNLILSPEYHAYLMVHSHAGHKYLSKNNSNYQYSHIKTRNGKDNSHISKEVLRVIGKFMAIPSAMEDILYDSDFNDHFILQKSFLFLQKQGRSDTIREIIVNSLIAMANLPNIWAHVSKELYEYLFELFGGVHLMDGGSDVRCYHLAKLISSKNVSDADVEKLGSQIPPRYILSWLAINELSNEFN